MKNTVSRKYLTLAVWLLCLMMLGACTALSATSQSSVSAEPGPEQPDLARRQTSALELEETDNMAASARNYVGNIRAPEFPVDSQWLNSGRRLSLADLRGKLVLLDFWTYGCINCMHIIPDLQRLEHEFGAELVVIGVHSAKFANESDLANVRQIILRYGIEHPVVNDHDMAIWQAYAVRAWPTTILIDPRGRVIASHSGEGVYDAYAQVIAQAVKEYQAQGLLNHTPLALIQERTLVPDTALSFPGKVLADDASQRLFIADSGHDRLVVTDFGGQVLTVIGTGQPGLRDGSLQEAQFNNPQGMALVGHRLYLADTGNHALRLIDMAQGTVSTIAGDGQMAYGEVPDKLQGARLNSPWDLLLAGDTLYIAMAGRHQIWVADLASGELALLAGTGREALLDGHRLSAALAQPSGLASDGTRLYVADSEASAVRSIEPAPGGSVQTIIGEGLFEFGDQDGPRAVARLQHPLGIVHHQGVLYVADTYNHKLKIVDPQASTVVTFLGQGAPGWQDGARPHFFEPGGLSAAGDQLYVADTNNHVVRVVELASQTVRTLALRDPEAKLVQAARGRRGKIVYLPQQKVQAGRGAVRLTLALPEGFKLNADAPSRIVWTQLPAGVRLAGGIESLDLRGRTWPLEIEAEFAPGQSMMRAEVSIYYCESAESVCLIELGMLEVSLDVVAGQGQNQLNLPLTIPLPG